MGDESLEVGPVAGEDAERGVPRVGELGRGADELGEDRVEVELGRERDACLDERALAL